MILFSPSKKLSEKKTTHKNYSTPWFEPEIKELVDNMKTYDVVSIKKLMKISEKLAKTNVERYQNFKSEFNPKNASSAIFNFQGDVYSGFGAETLNEADLTYANKHVLILSGLYGILRPFDIMQDYRLEMGISLPNSKGNTLYHFWEDKLTKKINAQLAITKSHYLFNLASKEYAKAVDLNSINAKVIEFGFKEWRNEKWTFISFNAKKARGFMGRFIVQNRITDTESLKNFNTEDYRFNEELSTSNLMMFTR